MSRSALVALWLCLLLGAAPTRANPVPDKVVREFNELPEQVARDNAPEDRKRLTDFLGRFGLQLLQPAALASLDRHFDALKSVMIEAQRPGHAIDSGFQAWFRKRAKPVDRAAMCVALKEWLSDPPTTAPPGGGMQTAGPPEAVQLEIVSGQLLAAETLADYGDRSALPAVRAVAIPHLAADDIWSRQFRPLRVPLAQTILRFEQPGKAGFLVADASGKITCVPNAGDIDSLRINDRSSFDRDGVRIDRAVAPRLMALMGMSRLDKSSVWGGSNEVLAVYLSNGLVARFSPTEEGRLIYSDNSRVGAYRLVLRNQALYDAVVALFPQGHHR